jgi:hypothetical protein
MSKAYSANIDFNVSTLGEHFCARKASMENSSLVFVGSLCHSAQTNINKLGT